MTIMSAFVRALRANPSRRTRFHTERGELIPLNAWPMLVESVVRRLTSRPRKGPWIVPSAVAYVERICQRESTVFEFGAGSSTPWLAARCSSLTSLEHDESWYVQVRGILDSSGVKNCDLRLAPVRDFTDVIDLAAPESIDLVLVDGDEAIQGDRLKCVAAARPKVKPGGYLLLDDSDRAAYRVADDILRGWKVNRFVGVKTRPLMAVETSIYRKPADANAETAGT